MTPASIDLYLAKLLLDQGLLNHYQPFILQAEKTLWSRRSSTALLLKAIRAAHKSNPHSAAVSACTKNTSPTVNVLDLAASFLDRKDEILPAAATLAPTFQTQFESDWERRTTHILQAVSELSQRPNPDNNEKINWEQQFRRWIQQENFESCLMPDPSILFSHNGPAASRLETALNRQKTLEIHPWFYRTRPDLQPLFSNLELSREPRHPTYIYTFDHGCLEGGIETQTTTLIAGVTSTGKSQLLRHMLLLPACHGEPTAYFSTEDSTDLIKKRSLSSLLKIPKRVMLEKTTSELEQMLEEACQTWETITPGLGTQIYNNIRRKFFAIYLEKREFRPEVMEDYIQQIEDQVGQKLTYAGADYLQEGIPNGGIRTDEDNTRALRRWMSETKEIAIRHKLAFLIAAQGKGEQVGRSTAAVNQIIAESFSATWGANYIFAIIRRAEETERLTKSSDQRNRQEIILAKSKDTALGITYALCDFATSTWMFFDTKEARDRAAGAGAIAIEDAFNPHPQRDDSRSADALRQAVHHLNHRTSD
jgi:hypothetical protein